MEKKIVIEMSELEAKAFIKAIWAEAIDNDALDELGRRIHHEAKKVNPDFKA